MDKAPVLIVAHSFIRRLQEFITRSHNNEYTTKLGISTPDFICKWHGVGGRTIAKVLKYDLSVVKEFGPDVIILLLGTNDLVNSSPLTVGSSLKHLVTLLGVCIIIGPLRSIAKHVFTSVAARQISVFPLRIAHIVHSLYNSTKGIFLLMVPKDLNAFLTLVHASDTAN